MMQAGFGKRSEPPICPPQLENSLSSALLPSAHPATNTHPTSNPRNRDYTCTFPLHPLHQAHEAHPFFRGL
jgi:hypothetical protein